MDGESTSKYNKLKEIVEDIWGEGSNVHMG